MADFMSLEIAGLKELMAKMADYPEKLKKKAIEPALIEITEKIRDKAKQNILKDCAEYADKHRKKDGTTKSRATGELAKHIVSVPKTKGLGKYEVARAVIVRKSRKISVQSAFKSFVKVGKSGELVFTGKLKGKHVRKTSSGKRVRVSAYYAHFVEYGTKNMEKRPFLRPASKAVEAKIPEIFAKHIKAVDDEINRYL